MIVKNIMKRILFTEFVAILFVYQVFFEAKFQKQKIKRQVALDNVPKLSNNSFHFFEAQWENTVQ